MSILVRVIVFLMCLASVAHGQAQSVQNAALASKCNTAGQSCPVSTDIKGQVLVSGSGATSLGKAEDTVAATGDVGIAVFGVAQDPLVADQALGDYGPLKIDANGRLITTNAPAGQTFQSCGTATAVTSDVAIKAAVASNRMYVTSITCKNTSTTVGPTLDFKDGATIVAVGGISATSATGTLSGEVDIQFPVPLRGTVNTAFNFATNTATTSVTCCIAGYISVS